MALLDEEQTWKSFFIDYVEAFQPRKKEHYVRRFW